MNHATGAAIVCTTGHATYITSTIGRATGSTIVSES